MANPKLWSKGRHEQLALKHGLLRSRPKCPCRPFAPQSPIRHDECQLSPFNLDTFNCIELQCLQSIKKDNPWFPCAGPSACSYSQLLQIYRISPPPRNIGKNLSCLSYQRRAPVLVKCFTVARSIDCGDFSHYLFAKTSIITRMPTFSCPPGKWSQPQENSLRWFFTITYRTRNTLCKCMK